MTCMKPESGEAMLYPAQRIYSLLDDIKADQDWKTYLLTGT